MGARTHISWADHTFNPWIGCAKVSPACDGCYAEALMDLRFGRVRWGGPGRGPGERVRTSPANWREPLRWNHAAEAAGTRPFVFCASLADVFDNQVPDAWRADLFDLIAATPRLVWLLLTKRPQNIARLYRAAQADRDCRWPVNAAIGCTVVTQAEADRDIPILLQAKLDLKAVIAFVSIEPMLGPINLGAALHRPREPRLDWVIAGGETDQGGHAARPAHPDWFRSLRDQCAASGTPFHFKQWGEWGPPRAEAGEATIVTIDGRQHHVADATEMTEAGLPARPVFRMRMGKRRAGRDLDGVIHDARPPAP